MFPGPPHEPGNSFYGKRAGLAGLEAYLLEGFVELLGDFVGSDGAAGFEQQVFRFKDAGRPGVVPRTGEAVGRELAAAAQEAAEQTAEQVAGGTGDGAACGRGARRGVGVVARDRLEATGEIADEIARTGGATRAKGGGEHNGRKNDTFHNVCFLTVSFK